MKLLLFIAVIVFASVADMLFADAHHVLLVIEWTKGVLGGIGDWSDGFWSGATS